jgi:hypothetical protein
MGLISYVGKMTMFAVPLLLAAVLHLSSAQDGKSALFAHIFHYKGQYNTKL